MTRIDPQKILCQCVDFFGHTWNVFNSRPTEHGWSILAGYPVVNGCQVKGMKGPPRTILTTELCAYFEEFRMKCGKMQLPLSSTAICKLRSKLGMNYWNDCKAWWKETEKAETPGQSAPRNETTLKPNEKNS